MIWLEESKGHVGLTAFPQCMFHLEISHQENEFLYYHVIVDLVYLRIQRYCIVGLQFLTCPIQSILLTIEHIWGWKLKFANVWTFSPSIFIKNCLKSLHIAKLFGGSLPHRSTVALNGLHWKHEYFSLFNSGVGKNVLLSEL